MNLITAIKAKLNRNKNNFPESKHIIKYSFTCGGVDYYEFDVLANMPWNRGIKFLSVYNELDMKCDRFYLKKMCEAILLIKNGDKIKFGEMSRLFTMIEQLQERLNWVYQEDLVYKLASVVFFDKTESPENWEWKHAIEKINHWKKHEPAASFFLREPMTRLLPFLNNQNLNLESYSEIQKSLDQIQLESFFANKSEAPKQDSEGFTQRYFSEEMNRN